VTMRGSGRLRNVLAFGPSVLAAGVLLSSGAASAAGPPALTLILGSYVQTGWHATSIRMCVRGGGCATRPVVVLDTITRPGPGGQREMVPPLTAMSSGRRIPSGVARLGPHGPPVQLTVTIYRGCGPALSMSATLGPVPATPGTTIDPAGYLIIARLTPDQTLSCYPSPERTKAPAS
jgi:hypothetical protein